MPAPLKALTLSLLSTASKARVSVSTMRMYGALPKRGSTSLSSRMPLAVIAIFMHFSCCCHSMAAAATADLVVADTR